MVLGVNRKKPAATRRTFNMGDDLYFKLRRVAYRERLNATQQLERMMDSFFADYEKQNKIKISEIGIPGEEADEP